MLEGAKAETQTAMVLELFQAQGELRAVGMGQDALGGPQGQSKAPDGQEPGGEGEKGTPRRAAVGQGVAMECWQTVRRGLAGQWEAGEACGEGKRKPWEQEGAWGWSRGGGWGLEPLWPPQPLHFSWFRFVNSCWPLAGGRMGPGPLGTEILV